MIKDRGRDLLKEKKALEKKKVHLSVEAEKLKKLVSYVEANKLAFE